MGSKKALLSPISIGTLKLKNKIVMPPMVIWESDESAEVKGAHLDHYHDRSGPGLIHVFNAGPADGLRIPQNAL